MPSDAAAHRHRSRSASSLEAAESALTLRVLREDTAERSGKALPGARGGRTSDAIALPGRATGIMPWLSVSDAAAAVAFYKAALGAETGEVAEFDGVVEVAELVVGEVSFWVQRDADLPATTQPSRTARAVLVVADPALCFDAAIDAGATAVAEVHDQGGWQACRVADPFGHHWEFARRTS